MTNVRFIDSTFQVVADTSHPLELSEEIKRKVDAIWEKELLNKDKILFNGQLFTFLRLEGNRLIGRYVEYKYYYALQKEPSLIDEYQMTFIGVTGITLTSSKVLLGLRSSHVNHLPHYYDFAPSGSMDTTDLLELVKQEFEEETNLSRDVIVKMDPFVLIQDPVRNAIEIGVKIAVDDSVEEALLSPTKEYEELLWISKENLRSFLQEHPFVPIWKETIQTWIKNLTWDII